MHSTAPALLAHNSIVLLYFLMAAVAYMSTSCVYAGLMSGTSLDAVDGVLVDFSISATPFATCSLPIPESLRTQLLELQQPSIDELHSFSIAGQLLSMLYAKTIQVLVEKAPEKHIRAIGCHGQTIRHKPEMGYTLQAGSAALLTELTGCSVVTDFRSQDIAAGGQGAPLVCAFHAAQFSDALSERVIVNLGGIANLTRLSPNNPITGFDIGPANMLMDAWIQRHQKQLFDKDGQWALSGKVLAHLLNLLMQTAFFDQTPPKSTGRDLFSIEWLDQHLSIFETLAPEDVQATLLELSCLTISEGIKKYCSKSADVFLCGGGAYNKAMFKRLEKLLAPHYSLNTTAALGIEPKWVEAVAFAWLAKARVEEMAGNVPSVTGAKKPRILGALYLA